MVAREVSESNEAHFSLTLAVALVIEVPTNESLLCISSVRAQETMRRFHVDFSSGGNSDVNFAD